MDTNDLGHATLVLGLFIYTHPQRLITRRNLSILLLDGIITQPMHSEMLCLAEAETCEACFYVECVHAPS